MSEVIWLVNGVDVAELGITVAGGEFRTQGVSTARLVVGTDFDAPQVLATGSAVVLSKSVGGVATVVFRGKVAPVSKYAEVGGEGQSYPLEDAWADLERTTYQELWALGEDVAMIPRAVLGLTEAGVPLHIGGQISAVIGYAASVGVSVQMGAVPAGEILWPEEVVNLSCAEVINKCLEFHPDWICWIDHQTSPPRFNVTASASLGAAIFPTDGSGDVLSFQETRRDDLVPSAVRIIFEYATTIDDAVYRNMVIQKAGGGGDGGPKVLCTTIPLAGGQMQMQKSRIRVRKMPDTGELGAATKKWVKANYPRLKDVDLEDFNVTEFTTTLVAEDEVEAPHPVEINKRARRLIPAQVSDIPNQLLEGQIEDWMRKKVGRVHVRLKVTPAAGASAEVQAKIDLDFPEGWYVCTNAITKVYKGITQWAAEEDMPVGIAEGVYSSMTSAYRYQGEVVIAEGELSGTRWHGKKVTLLGAATTGAAVHSVNWDVGAGITRIGFGPVPELAPADFLELQRRLRARNVTWWSGAERKSNSLGGGGDGLNLDKQVPSAAGDSVGGYHGPESRVDVAASPGHAAFELRRLTGESGSFELTLWPGWIREVVTKGADGVDGIKYHSIEAAGGTTMDADPPPKIAISAGNYLYVTYETDKEGGIKGTPKPALSVSAVEEPSTHYQPVNGEGSDGLDGTYKVRIGQLSDSLWVPCQTSAIDHFQELWTGKNVGDGGKVFKQRNAEDNNYEFRSLKGWYGTTIKPKENHLEINVDAQSIGGGLEVFKPTDDDPEAALTDVKMQFRTIRELYSGEQPGITTQISVQVAAGQASEADAEDTIVISGNGARGHRQVINGNIDWNDGLITTTDGDELLEDIGELGNLLYHNGSKWVALANPSGGAGKRVLTHDGTNLSWTETSECP